MSYTIETPFLVDIYAQDCVAVASQYRADVIARYQAMYENWWKLNRDEVSIREMQSILDRLGAVGIEILTDAAKHVTGLESTFPGELPAKYHSAPYEYHVVAPGRIVLDSLKDDWQPETPAEPDATPGQP
jgi:hypothetical protein